MSAVLTHVQQSAAKTRRSRAKSLVALLRPKQWLKNVAVLVVPATALDATFDSAARLAMTFAAFCLAASSVYVLNDYVDVERDRAHPVKRERPLPSGQVSPPQALALGCVTFLAAVGLALWARPGVVVVLAVYLGVNLLYCFRTKHVAIADVWSVSAGFVLRSLGGAVAIGVTPNTYLLAAVGAGSFALIVAKRRTELARSSRAAVQRPSLAGYTLPSLTLSAVTSAICAMILYLVYFAPLARTQAQSLVFAGIVLTMLAGLLRFLQHLVGEGRGAEEPTSMLSGDKVIRVVGVLWVALTVCEVVLRRVQG